MHSVRISCCLPPSKDVPAYASLAEEAGLDGVYLYDSPALYTDVWASLARIAAATSRITIGTGIAVPALRHPLVTASAIAGVEELAPGRLVCGFGVGFTGRRSMGQKPMRWEDMRGFLVQLRGLLKGETVEIDGGKCQMIHSPGFALTRPINVPLLVAASGPKGLEVAKAVADGIFIDRITEPQTGFERVLLLTLGTVLDPGEDYLSPRVRATAGVPYATQIHSVWEMAPERLTAFPGGSDWLKRLESKCPEDERHLAVHRGHLVEVTEFDQPVVDAAGPAIVQIGWTGTDEQIREHVANAAERGVTEIVMSLAGPDIPREIRALARATKP